MNKESGYSNWREEKENNECLVPLIILGIVGIVFYVVVQNTYPKPKINSAPEDQTLQSMLLMQK